MSFPSRSTAQSSPFTVTAIAKLAKLASGRRTLSFTVRTWLVAIAEKYSCSSNVLVLAWTPSGSPMPLSRRLLAHSKGKYTQPSSGRRVESDRPMSIAVRCCLEAKLAEAKPLTFGQFAVKLLGLHRATELRLTRTNCIGGLARLVSRHFDPAAFCCAILLRRSPFFFGTDVA